MTSQVGPLTLQSAATTGNGTAIPIGNQIRNLTFFVVASDATVSTGVVTLEEAHDPAFAGTWSKIADVTPVRNAVVASHAAGTYWAVRARISTNVTGGATVTVTMIGS